MGDILSVKNLSLSFYTPHGEIEAVKGVSFRLGRGEILGIVGESGCGKSILCKSITKLIPPIAKIKAGHIVADGVDITAYSERDMSRLRGSFFAYVFQNPMTALNPTLTVGAQIEEAIKLHDARLKESCNTTEFGGKALKLSEKYEYGSKISEDASCADGLAALKMVRPESDIRERTIKLLELVGIEQADRRIDMYPHEFSGGMRQRAVIAMALAAEPKVIFADEPTTALDENIGEQILEVFNQIRKRFGTSIVFVSHDIAAVRRIADHIAVMYDGSIVETGSTEEIFEEPKHPYTRTLLDARRIYTGEVGYKSEQLSSDATKASSRINTGVYDEALVMKTGFDDVQIKTKESEAAREDKFNQDSAILHIERLSFSYHDRSKSRIKALRDISMDIRKGEIFGIIGASGSGKSTLAGCIMNIHKPDSGRILYKGIDIWDRQEQRKNKRLLQQSRQLIFQDSDSSLNPRMRIADIIAEPRRLAHIPISRDDILNLMQSVGLGHEYADKYPSELSGGQRQRAAIARAVSISPELIIADEALASLDAPIQSQIVGLFKQMQREYGFTLIFISHDMEMVRYLCDSAAVIENGELVRVESFINRESCSNQAV